MPTSIAPNYEWTFHNMQTCTAKELAEWLSRMPDDTPVVIAGDKDIYPVIANIVEENGLYLIQFSHRNHNGMLDACTLELSCADTSLKAVLRQQELRKRGAVVCKKNT